MNVLVIGSGGREHALIWKIKQSPLVKKIFCAPGNAGIAQLAECVHIEPDQIENFLKFAVSHRIDLTVVGPEVPLVSGIVDQFQQKKLKIFGPSKEAARLEGSKVFAKEFMRRHSIPTANFQVYTEMKRAMHFFKVLKKDNYPVVIKADGLAAGKGVVICHSLEEAQRTLEEMIEKKIFKESGAQVVIEECLKGEEVSILAISDGEDFVLLDSAQDHKRIFDDDLGPNTGGMGAYSPTPFVSKSLLREIASTIIEPTITGMHEEGHPFKGVLYAGLMLTQEGPFVLEFNARFGDPETEVVLPRLKSDLVPVFLASCDGDLSEVRLEWDKRVCLCVVMSSGGYPGEYETGKEIAGLNLVEDKKNAIIFHAGTKQVDGKIVTAGGRVLGVTSLGKNIEEAIENAYSLVDKITFDKCFFRRDIGAKGLAKSLQKPGRSHVSNF